jgi:hypothetical protein
MRVPRNFFAGLLAGTLLPFGVYFGLVYWQLGAPTQLSYWCHDINTRKLARAQSIRGPKLLVVGGSGTLFGISARQLEAHLGVPTVNFGTHAALGPAYILHLVRQAAKPGDTVLLAIEFGLYERGSSATKAWASRLYIDYLMARDPAYFRRLPIIDQFDLALRLPTERLQQGLHNKRHPPPPPPFPEFSVYDPRLVDEHGDLTGHVRSRIPPDAPQELETREELVNGFSEERSGFEDIRAFCRWAQSRRVRVLATFPNICHQPAYETAQCDRTEAELMSFYRALDVPVLGSLREVMLPRSEFFDTCYHLTAEAAAARTGRLASHLAPYFAAPSSDSDPGSSTGTQSAP